MRRRQAGAGFLRTPWLADYGTNWFGRWLGLKCFHFNELGAFCGSKPKSFLGEGAKKRRFLRNEIPAVYMTHPAATSTSRVLTIRQYS
jgi:hypothetical protein